MNNKTYDSFYIWGLKSRLHGCCHNPAFKGGVNKKSVEWASALICLSQMKKPLFEIISNYLLFDKIYVGLKKNSSLSVRKHIPNFITCLNLACGCVAIAFAFGSLYIAAYLIAAAAIFDFLDGMFARWLHVKSEIGKQLDSLSDIVSFGMAPAFIIGLMILNSAKESIESSNFFYIYQALPFTAVLIPIFSALRLAKFNIDESQSDSFRGLPTPASGLFLASLPFLAGLFPELINPWILIGVIIVFCFLLVSPLRMFALKFKTFAWKENMLRYFFLGISLLLLIFLQYTAVPLIIIFYILLSIINK